MDNIHSEEFKVYSDLGSAIWGESSQAQRHSAEALTAAAVGTSSEGGAIERAAAALYTRAQREQPRIALSDPFFRGTVEQRLVLMALHGGRWSYRRIGRILGCSPDAIGQIAWSARLELAASSQTRVVYPQVPSQLGPSCPEYDFLDPWTQRLLDDELGSQELLFIQTHSQRCEPCRRALNTCRELYYIVDAKLQSLRPKYPDQAIAELEKLWAQSREIYYPSNPGFLGSLKSFFKQRDIQWFMVALVLLIAFSAVSSFAAVA